MAIPDYPEDIWGPLMHRCFPAHVDITKIKGFDPLMTHYNLMLFTMFIDKKWHDVIQIENVMRAMFRNSKESSYQMFPTSTGPFFPAFKRHSGKTWAPMTKITLGAESQVGADQILSGEGELPASTGNSI